MKSEVWPIEKLRNWDKNPRDISDKDFDRLKKQIKKLGVYKPLLITSDGEVLGGNMRLRALQALGQKDVWVSIVEPKDEAEKIEYALSDNDQGAEYDKNKLIELLSLIPIEFDLYNISLMELKEIELSKEEIRTLNIRTTKLQYEIIMQAINKVKEETQCSDGQAIERICADYLAGG